ncbi:MAG: ATPase, T2SS/T4P/T4SS family [Armatimonadota bacterium]|nr:ATPase, T2SS/T4P/T4SS family [Armatimonadota bacterium]
MTTLRITVRSRVGLTATQAVAVEVIREPEPARAPLRTLSTGRRVRLGQILVEAGVITQDQLRMALDAQKKTGDRIGQVILNMGLGSQEAIAAALAQQLNIEFLRIDPHQLHDDVLLRVPEPMARRHQVIPYRVEGQTLVLGMVDPLDLLAIDDVYRLTGLDVQPVVITADDFHRAIGQYPAPGASLDALLEEIKPFDTADEAAGAPAIDDAPIIRLTNLILLQAVRQGASDIHIEPQERQVRVRFRVDGTLRQMMTPPRHVHGALCSRIKIMANMNIAERRAPQDGRVDLRVDNREVRLRVSTVPTTLGEKTVIRILDKSNATVEIGKLGFRPDDARRFEQMIARPHGIVLFTGPTGSGKTTSLYAVLNRLNRPDVNVVTAEDPVEYELPGISQVQVNPKAGLTFAGALRSFLRQDPDVIMVGEIRDEETARLAIQAALTGHLVLSTLHTNDAPGAVARLTDMGIEPFLISSSVVGIVAQRLVRVLCDHCREPYSPSEELLASVGLRGMFSPPTFYKARGCEFCGNFGYRGRIGLFEVMALDETVRELITKKASVAQIRRAALLGGMRTLQDDGLTKVIEGVTSLEEVRRVVLLQPSPIEERLPVAPPR